MPHEENRKIIRVGTTSYAIILPKAWIRYNKLSAKDKLKVISNSNITIEPLQNLKKSNCGKRDGVDGAKGTAPR